MAISCGLVALTVQSLQSLRGVSRGNGCRASVLMDRERTTLTRTSHSAGVAKCASPSLFSLTAKRSSAAPSRWHGGGFTFPAYRARKQDFGAQPGDLDPLGFKDSIGQPPSRAPMIRSRPRAPIEAGDFILGYPERSVCPFRCRSRMCSGGWHVRWPAQFQTRVATLTVFAIIAERRRGCWSTKLFGVERRALDACAAKDDRARAATADDRLHLCHRPGPSTVPLAAACAGDRHAIPAARASTSIPSHHPPQHDFEPPTIRTRISSAMMKFARTVLPVHQRQGDRHLEFLQRGWFDDGNLRAWTTNADRSSACRKRSTFTVSPTIR